MKTQKTVAKKLGMKGSTLSRLLDGSRGMSRFRAAEMEQKTGIDRRAWLYPQEYDLLGYLETWIEDKINMRGRGRI